MKRFQKMGTIQKVSSFEGQVKQPNNVRYGQTLSINIAFEFQTSEISHIGTFSKLKKSDNQNN
jgi:hypothetical protein